MQIDDEPKISDVTYESTKDVDQVDNDSDLEVKS